MYRKTLSAMLRSGLVAGACMLAAGVAQAQESADLEGHIDSLDQQWDMIYNYCVECHNESDYTAGLSLEYAFPEQVTEDGETWETVIRKLSTGQMPPVDAEKPPEDVRQDFLAALESVRDSYADAHPNPGAPVLPRLNRTEYSNAVRDILHLNLDFENMLPADDSVEGFDNISTSGSISPALMESYLAASATVANRAVGDPDMPAEEVQFRVSPDQSQDSRVPGAPVGTMGGIVFNHYFPVDAEYEFRPTLYRGILDETKGLAFPSTLEITVDGERIHTADFGGYADINAGLSDYALAEAIDERLRVRTFVPAGEHEVTVTFLRRPNSPDPKLWRQFQRTVVDSNDQRGVPHLDQVDILGPYNATGPGETAPREEIFSCYPTFQDQERPCAREILSRIARKAFRRPVQEDEVSELLSFYDLGHEMGGFEKGVETGLRRIFAGPEFIFRAEQVPEGVEQGEIYQVNDIDLASRLSFFIWSSVPDEELLSLAIEGKLSDPGVLDAQIERMLDDPKADNLTTNFAAQWLRLRNLQAIVPDPDIFTDYDNNLRQASRQETEMLFQDIVQEDMSIMTLLNADYTYVNERLAAHYGIEDVHGTRMRRVPVPREERRGILGHSSILTLTSLAHRTSPVTRGKVVLETMIATPPPAPPADVPAIEESEGNGPSTVRELMTRHRADPVCASCHKLMDPVGFAMGNFDAVGRWQDRDRQGLPINTEDTMFDGSTIEGINGLRQFLIEKDGVFVTAFAEHLMRFALARPLEHFDQPELRNVVERAAENDYQFSSFVKGIVESVPFRMRRNEAIGGNENENRSVAEN